MFLNHHSIKLFLIASIMNVLLNVTMNLILSLPLPLEAYFGILVIYEIGTIFAEAVIIWKTMGIKFFKTLLYSLIANSASFLIGVLVGERLRAKETEMMIVSIILYSLYLLLFAFVLLSFIRANHKVNKQNNASGEEDRRKECER